MSTDPRSDPLIRMLADLPPIMPAMARDQRVVSRCHAALERQVRVRARAERARTALANTIDVVFATAVVFYAALVVNEAFRLTGT